MLLTVLTVVQAIISAILITLVLLQAKGQGWSMSFGGGGSVYRTRRGAERLVFNGTIVSAILFAVNSLILVILS